MKVESITSMVSRSEPLLPRESDAHRRCREIADWLVVFIAAALPWSTSAVSILIGLWLVALLPTLDFACVRRELLSAGGGLPVMLWLFAGAGMLWSEVPWAERLAWLGSYNKLLVVPLLLAQFHRSPERGKPAFTAFVLSCSVLLAVSYFLALWPGLSWRGGHNVIGVPVKDYVAQSGEFVLCAFALLPFVFGELRTRPWPALALGMLAALFIANVFYVASGRTALVVTPVLLMVFAVRWFGWIKAALVLVTAAAVAWLIWQSSPYLRGQLGLIPGEFERYTAENARTRIGERLEFWKKSVSFIAQAPVLGHGTGSTKQLFAHSAAGGSGASALIPDNPHNQTLAIAIQLGLVGVALLYAMWVSHLFLFLGSGTTAWIGLVVVLQNIVSCLFNSHLFDFTQGWIYVVGVGVAAGALQRAETLKPGETAAVSTGK